FYPQVLRLSPAVDEPWIWALLQLAPTPVAARALRRATLARLLARHRIRRVTAATVLAELHSPRCASPRGPRRPRASTSRCCCRGVRNALYHWGRVSAQHDPSTRRHYRALRQRGHGHARAIRGVIDRLLVVLMAMLRTGTTYDPARRRVPAAA